MTTEFACGVGYAEAMGSTATPLAVVQMAEPASDVMPAGQVAQLDAPAAEKEPAAQFVHCALVPAAPEVEEPAVQMLHEPAPGVAARCV
jgi:hypothetical protein